MAHSVNMTTGFILDCVVELLKNIRSKKELPQRSSKIHEELMSFYQALKIFEAVLDLIPDIQTYFVNCCDLCIQLRTQDNWKSEEIEARISIAIHMLRICRMALFVEFFRRMLHNAVANPKILLRFTKAIQDILTSLDNIDKFEKSNTPIQPPTTSLISHYREMLNHNFKPTTTDEFATSQKSQMIISPQEIFSPADFQLFKQHINEIAAHRKFAMTSGTQPYEPTLKLAAFSKQPSTQENSAVQLERSFIFTEMEPQKPDLVFFLFGVHPTDNPKEMDLTALLSLPVRVVDWSKIVKSMDESNDKLECAICLEEPAVGEKISVLFCKHWFHQECISSWFETQINKPCPLSLLHTLKAFHSTKTTERLKHSLLQPGNNYIDAPDPFERNNELL